MQLTLLLLTGLQVLNNVHSFRDYPANFTAPLSSRELREDKSCKNKCTPYEKSFKNVLSRKKRWFVFYKGTLVAITNVAAKALISPTPRGLIQSNEVDLFYEVPFLVEGWRKPLDDFIAKAKAQKKEFEEDEKERLEDEKLKNVGVVNASAIPLDEYYKTYPTPTWSHNSGDYHTNTGKGAWNQNRRKFNGPYRRPYNRGPSSSSRYNYQNSQRRNYAESRGQNRYYAPQRYYQNATIESNRAYQSQSHRPREEANNETPLWHHHREYRERRDIYDHLEKFGNMIGKSLRKCILRAICEMKQGLLPEGESFINDVARILFTVPTDHDAKDDEFTQMAMEENVDCARRFMVTCPHSPLDYFITNFQPKIQRPLTSKEMMENLIYA